MNRVWQFHRPLLGMTLCCAFLMMTGCQSGKLNMPKLSMPKMKVPNMAFWKKDSRIASQPNDQLTPPSQNMEPEMNSGSQSMAGNQTPGNRMPQRRPYDDSMGMENDQMASNPTNVRGLTPNIGEYNQLRNQTGAFSAQNDSSSGSTVSNPHFGGSSSTASTNNQFGGNVNSNPTNTPQFDNGYQDNSTTAPGGNSRLLKNEFVQSKTANPNGGGAFSLSNPDDSMAKNQYPDTGYNDFQNKQPGQAPAKVAGNTMPQFSLSETNSSKIENEHYQDKMNMQNEMTKIQHVAGSEIGNSSSQVRTAELPDALKGGSDGYMPGSTKPSSGTPSSSSFPPTGNPASNSGMDLPSGNLPTGTLPNQNSNELPMKTQPNQMFPPTSSPTNGGQFGGGQFGG